VLCRPREFDLYYGGRSVYTNTDKHQSVAFRMYRDGVRLLSFHKGVSTKELLDLLEALNRCMEIDSLEEDFVTLLWEKDLKRITYYEIEDYEEETEQQRPDERGALGIQDDVFGPDAEALPPEQIQDIEEMKNLVRFTKDELQKAREMIDCNEQDFLLARAWHVIQRTLELKGSLDAYVDLANAAANLIEMSIQRGQISEAALLLREAKALYGAHESPEIRAALGMIVDTGHADRNIVHIAEIISGNAGGQHQECMKYLSELSPRAVRPILGLTSVCKHSSSQQAIAKALASIAAGDPALILKNANTESPIETEIVLDALEMVGTDLAMREALKLRTHPSPKVRARVVSLATKINRDLAVEVAKALVNDEDPLVRRRALVTLVDVRGEDCEEFLINLFTSKQFSALSHDHKKGMLLVIKKLPEEMQDRVSESVFGMGGLFQRKSVQDTKKALTEVLNMRPESNDSKRPRRRRGLFGNDQRFE